MLLSYGYDQRMEVFGDFGLYQLKIKKIMILKFLQIKNIKIQKINDSFP